MFLLPSQNTRSPPPPDVIVAPRDMEMGDEIVAMISDDAGTGEGEDRALEEGIGTVGRRFFHRSNSTVCLGKVPPSPFDPLIDVLPLAEKPQLMDSVQACLSF